MSPPNTELRREPAQIGDRAAILLGDPRNDGPVAAENVKTIGHPDRIHAQALDPLVRGYRSQSRLGQESGKLLRSRLRKTRQLDRSIACGGNGPERAARSAPASARTVYSWSAIWSSRMN